MCAQKPTEVSVIYCTERNIERTVNRYETKKQNRFICPEETVTVRLCTFDTPGFIDDVVYF